MGTIIVLCLLGIGLLASAFTHRNDADEASQSEAAPGETTIIKLND